MLRSKQFGSYQILRKLGRGMTDVYLAFDTTMTRHVVLKIVEESPDPMTHIIMEAERRGAALQKQLHDFDSRVVEVYEAGDLDGYFFIAMQYIEGRNVAEILRDEKCMEPLRAARIAAEICSQLDRLHSYTAEIDGQPRAIVHGDIKPSNIQIGLNDEVRLLDFGIAKAITFTHNLTHHNFGSPSYCSPERLSKAQVDSHADLWAVGVTLYEMASGTTPYQAESTRKLEAVIQSRRAPRALPDHCPRALKAIITKALSGDLHQRYASAAAFRDDLHSFLQNRPTQAEKEKRTAWVSNETISNETIGNETIGNESITNEAAEKPKTDSDTVDKKLHAIGAATVAMQRLWGRRIDPKRAAAVLSLLTALLWGMLAGLIIFFPLAYYYRLWQQSSPLRANVEARRSIAEIGSDWDLFQRLKKHGRLLGNFSPVVSAAQPLRASLIAAADDVIERYQSSSDPAIQDFDWAKASLCLRHALDLDSHDTATQGKAQLCDGYLALEHSSDWQQAQKHFEQAAALLPKSPDPRLALARVYIYGSKNVGKALAEFHEAQRLGYPLGPREMEQQADGYRFRAAQEMAAAHPQLAQRDLERARQLYEPIAGYSNVSAALQQMDAEDRARQQVPVVIARKITPVRRVRNQRWR